MMKQVREDSILPLALGDKFLDAEELDKCPSAGEGAGNILSITCTFKKYTDTEIGLRCATE